MAILTVSREYGSGGREIGQAVAASLGYQYVDKETIFSDIRAVGQKWEQWGKDLDEHCPTLWEKYDWSFRGFSALVQTTILNYAEQDRVVIMGRGGSFLLKGIPYTLRVRVVAPLEARIGRIMLRESVDRETARWLAEKIDRERFCFLLYSYGKQWNDAAEYDLEVDTGKKPLDEIVSVLADVLLGKDQLKTEDAEKELRMRAAAARIKAGIATNPSFFIPTLEVFYDGTSLVLQGIIHNVKEHKRIEEAARNLAGDLPLKCELHHRK
jgi:cytidylate kinase